MSPPVVQGADASRPQSGILTPTSDASLNHGNGDPTSSESRKRKRADSLAMDHLLKPPITLKPHPPNLHVQPRTLQPLMLLSREHLPLSCLDLSAPHGELPPSRLFEAHIKILDLESRMGSAPRLLVARNESRGTLYALERHDNGIYVACKLGPWTTVESLASHATVLCQERTRAPLRQPAESGASQAIETPQSHKDHKQKRVAIEAIQSLVRKRPRSQSISTFDEAPKPESTSIPHHEDLPSASTGSKPPQTAGLSMETSVSAVTAATECDNSQQQTATSICDNIRKQYSEALYKSKGSLAYFAKGPLSRARSAFHLDLESNLDINELVDFLKSLVLTTVQVDKKYRETIPDLLSKMKPVMDSSDESRQKRRRSKKMKLGKDGLYPYEDESIRKWWHENKPELKDDDTVISVQDIKAHSALLRTRETQLQMIVIMEILALEPLKPHEKPVDPCLPALPGASDSRGQTGPPPTSKKRNKHNLPVLIDVHADRLTIWQSMASDEQLLLQDSQVPSSTADSHAQQKPSPEPLKDFCVDVIVPFYSSRLPQLCDSLSRKLGGPVIVSPPKPKPKVKSQKRPDRQDQRPGAAVKRAALLKEPKSLEHALSFEQKHRRSVSRAPSQIEDLMRATSALIPSMKREDSDSAGIRIPLKAEVGSRPERRGPLSRSSSLAGLDESKASRKAKIDAELRDAISNLRKPNREVVGKAMTEAAEHKATTITSAKKFRRGARLTTNSGIQVKATPANQRFKDAMPPAFGGQADQPLPSNEDIIPPSNAEPLAPSTAPRNSYKEASLNTFSPAAGVVGYTPMKKPADSSFLRRPAAEEPAIPPSSPMMARKIVSIDSPRVPASVAKAMSSRTAFAAAGLTDVPETPVKSSGPLRGLGATPPGPEQKTQGSIYDRLGWDDDELDDLL